jgi:hypothetical protein
MTANDVRAQSIEAGARAFASWWNKEGAPADLTDYDAAAAVVDAVEPIIRADERERIFISVRAEAMVGRTSWSVECLTDRDSECDGCLCTCHIEAEVRERIAQEIEAKRSQEWQAHLNGHPRSDGKKCPYCYGIHDALNIAARIARGTP